MLNYPVVFSVFSIIVLWLAAQFGAYLRRRRPMNEELREDFGLVEAATLTLLGCVLATLGGILLGNLK